MLCVVNLSALCSQFAAQHTRSTASVTLAYQHLLVFSYTAATSLPQQVTSVRSALKSRDHRRRQHGPGGGCVEAGGRHVECGGHGEAPAAEDGQNANVKLGCPRDVDDVDMFHHDDLRRQACFDFCRTQRDEKATDVQVVRIIEAGNAPRIASRSAFVLKKRIKNGTRSRRLHHCLRRAVFS